MDWFLGQTSHLNFNFVQVMSIQRHLTLSLVCTAMQPTPLQLGLVGHPPPILQTRKLRLT